MLTYKQTKDHLISRSMIPEYYGVSVSEGVASIPLREFSGRQVGYQEYRPFAERNCRNVREARYFTYLPRKVNGYFGLESLKFEGPVYLVEGVFKACKLHGLGLPAISLMGSETRQHISQIRLLRRPYIGIGDNDASGHRFANALNGFVSPQDLDEMTDDGVRRLLDENY